MNQFETDQNSKKYTYAVYILQALSIVVLFTALIGIIINYIKDEDVEGTWLQSHFIWQKNTFWYGLLWTLLGVMTIKGPASPSARKVLASPPGRPT
ncbi:MAG: hypothetical protein IIC09_03090 [Proteobacteria bacterium]|nr:hypothetical protein [Pseudomonadota bacterium]